MKGQMEATTGRLKPVSHSNGVHKPSPKRRQPKADQFATWLKSVPAGVPRNEEDQISLSLTLTTDATYWMQLAQGASRNGWTLEECAMRLIVEGGPGLSEWQNQGFIDANEQATQKAQLAEELCQTLEARKKGGGR